MTALSWPPKDPDELLDYEIDWTKRMPASDSIAASTWVAPTGLSKVVESVIESNKVAVIWLAGGAVGETYPVLNTVTTQEGRIMQQTVRLKVKSK